MLIKCSLIVALFSRSNGFPCNPYGSNGNRCPTRGTSSGGIKRARPQNGYVDKNRIMSNTRIQPQNFRPQLMNFEQSSAPTKRPGYQFLPPQTTAPYRTRGYNQPLYASKNVDNSLPRYSNPSFSRESLGFAPLGNTNPGLYGQTLGQTNSGSYGQSNAGTYSQSNMGSNAGSYSQSNLGPYNSNIHSAASYPSSYQQPNLQGVPPSYPRPGVPASIPIQSVQLPLYPGLAAATTKKVTETTTTTTTKTTTTTPAVQPLDQQQLLGNMPSGPKAYPDPNTGSGMVNPMMNPMINPMMNTFGNGYGNMAQYGGQYGGIRQFPDYSFMSIQHQYPGMANAGQTAGQTPQRASQGNYRANPSSYSKFAKQSVASRGTGTKPIGTKPSLSKSGPGKPSPVKHNGTYGSKIEKLRAMAAAARRPPTRPPVTTVATTTSTYSPHDCGRDTHGILWCAGNRIYEKPKRPKKKPAVNNGGRVVLHKFTQKLAAPAKPTAWVPPKPNLKIAANKQQVKMQKPKPKSTGGGGGSIFAQGGDIPAHIKTVPHLSPTKSEMCRSGGGWGQPCSYDMGIGDNCDEKQFWSDNGYTRYIVKCVRSKKYPARSVRLKTVMTCDWGNCRNGGGSG